MLSWLSANLINIVLVVILLLAVFLILRSLVRRKSSCGCGCEHCKACGDHTVHKCTKS